MTKETLEKLQDVFDEIDAAHDLIPVEDRAMQVKYYNLHNNLYKAIVEARAIFYSNPMGVKKV